MITYEQIERDCYPLATEDPPVWSDSQKRWFRSYCDPNVPAQIHRTPSLIEDDHPLSREGVRYLSLSLKRAEGELGFLHVSRDDYMDNPLTMEELDDF